MDALDRRLWEAWDRMQAEGFDADRVQAHSAVISGALQLSAPLRSWSLVLRAGDTRIVDRVVASSPVAASPQDVVIEGEAEVWLDGEEVRRLCGMVQLPWPGVTVVEASRRLGVSLPSVWRWCGGKSSPRAKGPVEAMASSGHFAGRLPGTVEGVGVALCKRVMVNEADRKRDQVRVWQRYAWGVDPSGELAGLSHWGALRREVTSHVPDTFSQVLRRVRRVDARGRASWQWRCPTCCSGPAGARSHAGALRRHGRCLGWVTRLYWVMPTWTIAASMSATARAAWRLPPGGFVCRGCAGLVYESSERWWGRGTTAYERQANCRAIAWDRLVRRVTSGRLRGKDVTPAPD
jgi:hypothetical protein